MRRGPGSNLEGDQPRLGGLFLGLSLPARLECFGFLLSGRNLRGTSPDFPLLARIREHPVIRGKCMACLLEGENFFLECSLAEERLCLLNPYH